MRHTAGAIDTTAITVRTGGAMAERGRAFVMIRAPRPAWVPQAITLASKATDDPVEHRARRVTVGLLLVGGLVAVGCGSYTRDAAGGPWQRAHLGYRTAALSTENGRRDRCDPREVKKWAWTRS